MKQYQLLKDQLNIQSGTIFLESPDGTYRNSINTVTLTASVVEESKEYFKRIEDLTLWRPEAPNQAFWTVTPDLGCIELGWDENRFSKLWSVGNVFENEKDASEVASAIAIVFLTYQKKFSEKLAKMQKPPKILQQQAQQPTPPVQPPNIPPPPNLPPQPPQGHPNIINDPRLSVFNKFTVPGAER